MTRIELTRHLHRGFERIRTLGEDLRLEIEHAGKEARERWEQLELYRADAEHHTRELGSALHAALGTALGRLRGRSITHSRSL